MIFRINLKPMSMSFIDFIFIVLRPDSCGAPVKDLAIGSVRRDEPPARLQLALLWHFAALLFLKFYRPVYHLLRMSRRTSEMMLVDRPKQMERYFNSAIERGLEGVMAKKTTSIYKAGARGYNWIKMKRSYKGELSDTVDLVIIGYFLGRGSRTEFGFGGRCHGGNV